jgi:hypothetical protein
MVLATFLRLMSYTLAPHPGVLELRNQLLVQTHTEIFDTGTVVVQHHGSAIIGNLTFRLQNAFHHEVTQTRRHK